MKQEEWDKNSVICLVGYMSLDNTFLTLENEEYDCTTYRIIYKSIKPDVLSCVNLKWKAEPINAWVIFQYVLME